MIRGLLICAAVALASAIHAAEPLDAKLAERLDAAANAYRDEHSLPGLAIGVVTRDGLVFAHGFGLANRETKLEATPSSVFRVGSLTKVFTATLLVEMRDEGTVALDDPLSKYLPAGTTILTDPRGAREITLRHLTQHTSGLPRLSLSVFTANRDNPYAHLTPDALMADLATTNLRAPVGESFEYSNFGVALLGLALSRAAGKPYAELMEEKIFAPYGMTSTTVEPTDSTRDRWSQGYALAPPNGPIADWEMATVAPAGGMSSSVEDLAKFLAANMGGEGPVPIRASSMLEMRTVSRLIDSWSEGIGLGWFIRKREGGDIVWHNGMTGNHASYVGFVPERGVGVIVLTNMAVEVQTLGVDILETVCRSVAAEVPKPPDEVTVAMEGVRAAFADPKSLKVDALFSKGFLAQFPPEKIDGLFSGVATSMGAVKPPTFTGGQKDGRWTALYQFEKGRLAVTFALEPDGKIGYFLAKPQ